MKLKTKLFVTTMIAGLASSAALAQSGGIETVVVTAEKRARDVQKVAMSIDVKTSEDLKTFNVSDFKALQNYVPNLLIQSSPGNDAIFIRGFGSQAANYAFDQSVSLYLDGIYGGRNRQFMAPFFDVERIEIMRGPQGALLGKNTAAGALSIITANPTEEFEARIATVYNVDRGGVDVTGHISGPMSEQLSGRLAVQYTSLDGYVRNTFYNEDDPQIRNVMTRGTLRFEPQSNIDITAKLEYGDFTTYGTNAVRINPTTGAVSLTRNASPGLGGIPERDHANSLNSSITANFGIGGDHTLTVIGGYSHFIDNKDVGGGVSPTENWLSRFRENFDQYSLEARVLSPTGQTFEYIAGVYWDTADYRQFNGSAYNNFLGIPGFNGNIQHVFKQTADTWSVFGMATWNITDDIRILGSARYTDNSKDGNFNQTVNSGIPIGTAKILNASISEGNFDPSLTLQYDVTDDVMAYFSYGRGSKAGGFVAQRAALPNTFTFAGERSTNYEVGVKSKWFDGTVLFNLSLYQMPFEDLQVSVYAPTLASFITGNAASATSQGFEAQLGWLVVPELQLDASVAFLEAVYDDFLGATCLAPPLQPATCVAATNNLAGYTLPGISKWTGNLRATYKRNLNEDLMMTLIGAMYFRSTFTTTSDLSPIYGTQRGYAKFDARLEISDAVNDKWSVALIGKNLSDKRTINFGYLWPIQPPATGIGFLEEGRTLSIEGTLRF